jgi:hypothetical protein
VRYKIKQLPQRRLAYQIDYIVQLWVDVLSVARADLHRLYVARSQSADYGIPAVLMPGFDRRVHLPAGKYDPVGFSRQTDFVTGSQMYVRRGLRQYDRYAQFLGQ